MAERRGSKTPVAAAAAVAVLALLFSGGRGLGGGGGLLPGTGNSGNTSGVKTESTGAEAVKTTAVSETTKAEASEETAGAEKGGEEVLSIRIDGVNIYFNDEAYKYSDAAELEEDLKNELYGRITDNTQVLINYKYGDYNTYSAVNRALEELAVEATEIRE